MYKSVSIRDSRQSLELNASLWRLSWITFIFLPLTFLVGFFGMNVGIFEHNPSVKYYFITAVPLVSSLACLAKRRFQADLILPDDNYSPLVVCGPSLHALGWIVTPPQQQRCPVRRCRATALTSWWIRISHHRADEFRSRLTSPSAKSL